MGVLLKNMQNFKKKAFSFLSHSIKLNPYYAQAHYNLGNVLREMGQFVKSIDNFERALDLDQDMLNWG